MLKKNYLEFGNTIKQQIVRTASGTKFFPLWARIFMNDLETKFLEGITTLQNVDDIFFICTHGEEGLKKFLDKLNDFNQQMKFTYEHSVENLFTCESY